MSIKPFIRHCTFEPEQIAVMSAAFESVCRDLGLAERTDALRELVARHIIEAAANGVLTKTALYLGAVAKFKSNLH
jgi:hypothetical protein